MRGCSERGRIGGSLGFFTYEVGPANIEHHPDHSEDRDHHNRGSQKRLATFAAASFVLLHDRPLSKLNHFGGFS
jgi:hypothetical protein